MFEWINEEVNTVPPHKFTHTTGSFLMYSDNKKILLNNNTIGKKALQHKLVIYYIQQPRAIGI